MTTYKHLFTRALAAVPERLHFAAHSHHLWPDASHEGQMDAWADAAHLADNKWELVMGLLWSEAQGHVASELRLPDRTTVSFSPNTHDFLLRIFSAIDRAPVRVLSTDGEFHSFRRQMARWVESGVVMWDQAGPDVLAQAARAGDYDLIFASHVLFSSGAIIDIEPLAALAGPQGPWVVIDGYHGFMAIPTDLSTVADRIFYLAGGYKYAMAGEGVCFLHAPPEFARRPAITGWYAEFDDLAQPPGSVGYASDGRRFLGSTFDPSGLYRFCAVRAMLEVEGLSTRVICDHVTRLQQLFLSEARMPDMQLLNPLDDGPHARFLAFKGSGASKLHDSMAKHHVVTDVRGDVLRIGFGIYQDESDVDRLTVILKTIV
ncbi:MAG: aminotransferase class V-fold PLP-dependent enzyme [Sphingomonadaceae bacterium]|nr:aminotransferase class V-fold PLP-dependent enzyme [Sphingomonadaceae bacterium]